MPTSHGEKEIRGHRRVPLSPLNEGRFGRMFRRLPPAPKYGKEQLEALAETMHESLAPPSGGWASNPQVQPGGDNPDIPAAYTYFGQFVDHDITFDPNSSLQQQNDPDALHDFRTPKFDLDSLYGSGPDDEPFQYQRGTVPARLLLGASNGQDDLPRNSEGTAMIGDPRNDENIIVSQLQLTFLKFHNKIAAEVEAELSGASALKPAQKMAEAQRRVRWTYQQVVIKDYLRRLVGAELLGKLFVVDEATGASDIRLKYYRAKNNAYMPIEFSAAAYRFGHSQVRGAYDLNDTVPGRPIFIPGAAGELEDLRGGRSLPPSWTIQWKHFVDLPGVTDFQPSRLLDTHLSEGLFTLPGDGGSLAMRNLVRGQSMGLPSGQDVAKYLGAPVLAGADLGDALDPTPLWYYILKEAELGGGLQLGPVGGRIVAEVLLGLLANDKTSWINVEPAWRTSIPTDGDVTLADIIRYVNN